MAIAPGWATRFYGMPVPKDVAASVREHLTDPTIADLVDAHLAINEAYFGGIDKTLSGFVILADEGDDYTLLDLRDSGLVYRQDHETRDVVLRDKRAKKTRESKRKVSTVALCARYQWLVWLLARPLIKNGVATQTTDYLVRNGIGRLRYVFPRRETLDQTFAAELPALGADPHLAIYWLLHTTALVDDERRDRVLAELGKPAHELLAAFVARLGRLPLAGDLPIVPDFRARRALAITYGAFEIPPEQIPVTCLRALEIAPEAQALAHGLQVVAGLERGQLAEADVEATLARIPDVTPGTELVAAMLDKRRAVSSSKHADKLAQLLATTDSPWWTRLEALWHTHELSYDGGALVDATRRLLHHDRYHRRALQMAMRASQIANQPIDRIYADLVIADGVMAPFSALADRPEQWRAIVDGVTDAALRRGLAWRVLQRVELNRPPAPLVAWAAGEVLASRELERVAIVGEAFAKLDAQTQTEVIDAAGAAIDRPDHPSIAVLLACIDSPEPRDHDYVRGFQLKRGKEGAVRALAPWAHEPPVFDALMRLVDRPAGGQTVELIWSELFSPFQEKTYVLPRLDDAQAVRAARAMIKSLGHADGHARSAARQQLVKFHHRGAESFLIDALTDYGVRSAAAKDDQLESIVANLYDAVRRLGTPAARTALVERLFAERRAYWRMGNALGEIWDQALHEQIMKLLADRKDPRAAGAYAFALQVFVKQGPPLVELARLIVEWQGDNEVARRFLHYALVVGMVAALDARDYELVRRTHDAASWIAEPPVEPDDYVRGIGWQNPVEDPDVKARLERVLSGAAERAKQELVAAMAAARAKNKPNKKISDEALGQLADSIVTERLLTDAKTGEVWFLDRERQVRYFDGYGIAAITARAIDPQGAQTELADATELTDRALWWDAKADRFRDAFRLGDRVLLSWGVNNGALQRYLLVLPDAAAFMAKLRAYPPRGFKESDPYYLAGKGAIVRVYYVPDDDQRERNRVWLLDAAVCDEDLGSPARALAEHARREVAWLAEGGVLTTLEWFERHRKREDMTVREWIKVRFRDDRRDPRWHLDGMREVADYLRAYGLAPKGLAVELGPPANDIELEVLRRERKQALPTSLRELWREIGSARWQLAAPIKRGMRLLGPREMIERRQVAREAGEQYLNKLPRDVAERSAATYRALDVLVESLDGTPVTFIADIWRDDGRVFSHAADHPDDFWWEVSLSWIVATRLLAGFEEALAAAVPAIDRLRVGVSAKPKKKPATKKKTAKPKPTKKPKKSAAPKKKKK